MSTLSSKLSTISLLLMLSACAGSVKTDSDTQQPLTTGAVPSAAADDFSRAVAAMASGQEKAAESIFSDLTSSYPSLPGPWNNLGIIKYNNKDYDTARAYANKALAAKADYAEALNLLAMAEVQLGEINTAKEHYLKALALKPDYALAHYNTALLYDIYYQEIDNAILHYIRYLELITTEDTATREWLDQLIRQRKG